MNENTQLVLMPNKFIQVGDDLILNVNNVNYVHKLDSNRVWIYLRGEEDPIKFRGEQAQAIWTYFISYTPNICPGESAALNNKNAEVHTVQDFSDKTN
ncbi:hypothetical protein I8752_29285 [Nostocaceae cyanobacterium CENA369]|uniref:Uncharacterized protein n=1 Tax=Dendronalium phyllosphericum CENA369 TaxID=1725256 RepID=A0A8J7I7L8_9NOST|nr:hypothetical protein [Dendronalium phyllosphericum]MBH8577004.1 hypothetical protein [Dendronalium phyllosphericum CENA369]